MTTIKNLEKPTIAFNQIIREINWALLASITVHGIFFTLIFPRWYAQGNSNSSNGLTNTPIIELNSLEQTRLPNLNPSNSLDWNSLNPLPEIDNFNGLTIPVPPLESLENSGFDLPPLDGGMMYQDFSALPPPPPASISNFSTAPIPQTSLQFETNSTAPLDLPPPPPINQKSLANLPPIPQDKIDQITEKNNSNTSTSSPFKQTDVPVNQILDAERQAEIRRQLFANSPIEVTVNPRDVINNRDNKTDVKDSSNPDNNLPVKLENQFNNLTDKLAPNPENTSDEEARKNYIAWAKNVQNVNPKEITIVGAYPKDACVKKLEGTTTYGVVVNSMGNVVDTQLIKSSGYNLFNEQALKQINARQFENTGNGNIPYHVYVNFQYDTKVCPSVSLSNLGNVPQSSPQPSSNPNPVKPNNVKPATPNNVKDSPSNSQPSSEKTPVKKENSNNPQIKQPTTVNKLSTPTNSAEVLLKPNPETKKTTTPPKLPPIIENPSKKDSQAPSPSAREIINPSVNSSGEKEQEKKSPENEVIIKEKDPVSSPE
ncbi:TonB family protein [Cyanobacterium aponinum]|uniref:TonB family protein n=1 Tax=Cyanobacterium aponinum (strain PCC 10605) TaxID=755178 RepID=K9Z7P7_CYAAP|nr:TonB family protein [Cyanobacterium aponinum]AFZ54610.1 TonB family protein [Cyanobacterium aponinum PCC 10605]